MGRGTPCEGMKGRRGCVTTKIARKSLNFRFLE